MRTKAILLLAGLVCGTAAGQAPDSRTSEEQVVAVVLGRPITVAEKDQLNGLIFGTLLGQFAKDHGIEPTDEELDAFVERTEMKTEDLQAEMEEKRRALAEELKDGSLSPDERKEKESRLETIESFLESSRETGEQVDETAEQARLRRRQIARHFVLAWKINKALYEKYGGRVIFQQAGVEPLDAYREFLREEERKGSFEILDKQLEPGFWRYFTNDAMHTFYSDEEGARFINTPWWTMDEAPP